MRVTSHVDRAVLDEGGVALGKGTAAMGLERCTLDVGEAILTREIPLCKRDTYFYATKFLEHGKEHPLPPKRYWMFCL